MDSSKATTTSLNSTATLPGWGVSGHYAFRPRLLPTLAMLLVLPLFVSLGLWQFNKARAKAALQAELDQRSQGGVVQLAPPFADAELLRFRHVAVRGRFEPERQIFLDNRIHREQAGYHVLTPLRIDGSETRVLVNRGWIPAEANHRQVPTVATPTTPIELEGIVVLPPRRVFRLAPEAPGWHALWQNLDLEAYGAAAGFAPLPLVIQLDAASPAGFAREWPRPDERMEKHLSYALQWAGFAIALVGFWLVASLRRRVP